MIAREGIPFILIGLALTIVSVYAASRWDSRTLLAVSAIFALLTLFTTFFFRDPERRIDQSAGLLVSPADGTVLRIDTLENHPFVPGPVTKISIFLSVFNVHVNRVPATGRIDYVKYNPGKFFAAYADKASELNEQTEIGMTASAGEKLVFKQIAGLIARRIVCHLISGESVQAGQRFGMIRFGSRAELFIPAGSTICIKPGDKVKGGETVIGRLPSAVSSQGPSDELVKAKGRHE